jgi:tagatose 6-phosphate kinase
MKGNMSYILTVTLNAAVDTTLTMTTPFEVGQSHRARDVLKLPGGKGINVARALHTLGVPVRVSGLLGGLMADFIKTGLAQSGIDESMHPITGTCRTCTAVVERDSRRVTEINEPGPTITEVEARSFLDLYAALLPQAAAVVLSGALPPGLPDDYYARLLERAQAANVPAVLDTSGASLRSAIAAHPLLVKPNAAEATQFSGRELLSSEDAVSAGESMRLEGARLVALTRGAEGAVLVSDMGAWSARVDVSDPLSAVGSGDAFVGGFIAGLWGAVEAQAAASLVTAAADANIAVEALKLAMACGAANTLRLGAGVFERADIEHFRQRVEARRLRSY